MASLLNNASLLLNPAGSIISYQEDKIYSVLPKDGTGDFTFSGGDGGTRVNQQGYIEQTPANVYTNSNNFSTWSPKNGTFSQGVADPFGGNNAWVWTATDSDPYLYQNLNLNGIYTVSIYVKGVGSTIGDNLQIRVGGTPYGEFTLTNEWQRFEWSNTLGGSANIGVEFGNPASIGDVVHVAFAQLNLGSTALPYQPTTDRLNYPRITYQNGRGALLNEPQRTNLITYSQQFDNAAWEKAVATVTANTTISPDGTQNADTITCNGTGYQYVRQSIFGGTNQSCACSVYVKRGSARYFAFRNSGNTSNHDVFDFDSSAWVTNNTGATLSYEVLKDGWFRLMSVNSNVNNFYWSCFPTDSTSGAEVTTSSNLTVYVWGGQGEQNATYVSSYIPTTSATVTRPADSTNNTNTTNVASVVGQTEGVFYSDLYFEANGAERNYMYLNTNGSYNNGFLYLVGSTNNKLIVDLYNFPYTPQFSAQSPTLTTGRYKAAIAYKQNDFAFYLNGVQIATDNSGTVPTLNRMYIGQGGDVSWTNGAPVFTTGFFPTRLTNTQLAELTTVRSGSGGNISYYGPYTIHTFTGSGTFTPSFSGEVEVLVVAGGGAGGGGDVGGGGGAGGLLYVSSYGVSQGTGITVTVGAGGTGVAIAGAAGGNGSNSVFGGLTAIGGGGGAGWTKGTGNDGGSGGGATYYGVGGKGTPGQGNDGGTGGVLGTPYPQCGGGGAGQIGLPATGSTIAGNGGAGLPYSISGFSTYYAGGGGGATEGTVGTPGTPGTGGLGGGGNGGSQGASILGTPGVNGLGGGGGGCDPQAGANGGSGVVIVRYLT